jgi:hypothetical protein
VFLGHFAVGLAAKRAVPGVSLGVLFLGAQLADVLWPLFVALGVERVRIEPGNTAFTPLAFDSYPYSHSLLLLTIWGLAFAWLVRRRTGAANAVAVVAAVVVSHWLLDWVSHRPDLPLYPGGPRFGLGLWNSVPATLTLEGLMYAAGLWVYLRTTRPRDAAGRRAFAGLALMLGVIYIASAFGGPPPSVTAVVLAGSIGFAVLAAWAWWADAHRRPV